MNFLPTPDGSDDSIRFQPIERLKVYLFGVTILFASFGMGEAVYRKELGSAAHEHGISKSIESDRRARDR